MSVYRNVTAMLVAVLVTTGGCDQADQPIPPAAHVHAVAGETCFICDASLRDPGRLWCAEHARYEDRCWLCHPELRDPDRMYCAEHGLYEDECFLCRPALRQESSATPSGSGSDELFCHAHQVPELECGICQPALASTLRPGESMKIRLPSARSAQLAGITTGMPGAARPSQETRILAEVRYNGNRLAVITPLGSGVVRSVAADLGREVRPGDVLAELTSPQTARAKGEYLSAQAELDVRRETYERERRLLEEKISARRDFAEAEAAYRLAELRVRRAHQELLNLGLTTAEIETIARDQDSSSLLVVRAPFAGSIVERRAVVGEAVEIGTPLFELADLSSMWLELSVPETMVTALRPGAPIEASLRSLPGRSVQGEITWIGPSVDVHTRMVRARAVVPNPDGALRDGMFAEVSVRLEGAEAGLAVPRGALQTIDGLPFVFVPLEDDLFAARRVAVRDPGGAVATITAGLRPEESVVIDGAFTMKSELLKSRLGAGCADH